MKFFRAIAALLVLLAPIFGFAQLNTTRVMEIGRNALYFEDYVLSIQYFNKVIDSKPYLHEPYFYRGLAKYYLDDFVGADEDLTSAIERNPYVARSYQLRGLCRAHLDSLALAEQDLRMGIKYDLQNVDMWRNLAAVVMQAGEWEKAADVVDSLLVFAPRNSTAYVMRAQVAMNMQDTVAALAMANKAVQCDEFSADVYDVRSMVYYAMKEYEDAEADMDKSIELHPERSGSYANRALVRYARENLRGALADFNTAVQIDSTVFSTRYNRGLLLMEFGENNKAIEDFDMVLAVDPDNTMARFNRAILRSAVGDFEGAISDFTVVIDTYPNFEQAYAYRADVRRKYGDDSGALADEKWLYDRWHEVYMSDGSSVPKEYVVANDEVRKRSEENIRHYNRMIVPAEVKNKHYMTEARGKVQDKNVYIEFEPLFVLTYYKYDDGMGTASLYNAIVEEYNAKRTGCRPLLLTNKERALSGGEVEYHFGHIDEVSKEVSENDGDAPARLERAVDYYLVQDVEAAMGDADKAVSALGDSWVPFFIRAFVRYKQLELARMNAAESLRGVAPKQDSHLSDIDCRLVKSDLDRVIELQPSFAEAYFNRANVLVKLNDYKSAIVDYTAAISLNDRFAEAYYNRGLAKIYTGNTEGGVADLSKAGELGMYQAYSVIKRFR